MPDRSEVAYFGAGPAPLPTEVLNGAAEALLNYNNSGLGLAEISHRSAPAAAILEDAKTNLAKLLEIPNTHDILFLQGGGTGGFSSVVQNLVAVWVERRRAALVARNGAVANEKIIVHELNRQVREELRVDYLVTGSWSLKASQEAKRLLGDGYVNIAVDARETNQGRFGTIPPEDSWKLTPRKREGGKAPAAFVYYCDNETVDGVEFPSFPKRLEQAKLGDEEDEPLVVADVSSNFLSRKIDVSKFGVIFGGAQKNIGAAGVTLLIVRKSLLPPNTASPPAHLLRQLDIGGLPGPIVFDYATAAKNNSLYNTLPIFNLWIAGEVIANLVKQFGEEKVGGQEKIANLKAKVLYNVLDKYPSVYQVVPDKAVRSRMNICFRVHGADAEKEKTFLGGAEKRLLQGLKGHRSVGGIRVSNYNAVPVNHVEKLVKYLEDFANESA